MFDGPVSDWDLNKTLFLSWCKFYYDLREMTPKEKPTQEVIENDYLLDKHLDEIIMKRKQEEFKDKF